MPITTCVFDAYGTLFDVTAAARTLAEQPGRSALKAKAEALSATWRAKQLGYSWLRAVSGAHCDFWQVTCDALDFALEATRLQDPELREELLALYWELAAYREVPAMLAKLKAMGRTCAILSNGSPDMLEGAVKSAGIETFLDAVLSVESVGVFKPDARVYGLVPDRLGCTRDEVLFVSSNGWDAACATGFGFTTAWVNRAGEPMDRLPWKPAHVLSDLTSIPELAA